MDDVQLSDDEILLKFESCRSLFIKKPQKITVTRSPHDTWLSFGDFEEVRLEWIDFGHEDKLH